MFKTRARGAVPVERFGTCTITVLVKPFTLSDSVVDPGEVDEQPEDAAAATDCVAALNGTAPTARIDSVATARVPVARRTPRFMRS